ncbi:MAG: glycosyltransferase family 4 protein [bacterium]
MVSEQYLNRGIKSENLRDLTWIVFSIDYKPVLGGVAEHAYRIALNLSRRGANVYVVAPRVSGGGVFDSSQPFRTIRVLRVPFLDWFFYLVILVKLTGGGKKTIIYCATSYPCGFICRMLKVFRVVRVGIGIHAHEVVYGDHNLRQKVKKALRRLQVWAFINSGDRVFAVSRFTADMAIAAAVKPEKIAIIYNGIDLGEIDQVKTDDDLLARLNVGGKKIILSVGRLEWRKGFDMVIRAMPEVLKSVPDAIYLIVGDGKIREDLEKLSSEVKVAENVIFAGSLSRNHVLGLIKSCDVLVMPSRQEKTSVEGFGIVFLEAGACGKPVIGGRSGGIADAVEEGVTGLLVDPVNPKEIAESIKRILLDKKFADRLGANGRERVSRDFTWDKVVERIINSIVEDPSSKDVT